MEFVRPQTNNPMIKTLLEYINERVNWHKDGSYTVKTGLLGSWATDIKLRTEHTKHAMNAVKALLAIKRQPTGEFNYEANAATLEEFKQQIFSNKTSDPKGVYSNALKALKKTKGTYVQPYLDDFDVRGILRQAYHDADRAFQAFRNGNSSENNGIQAGVFSCFRHGSDEPSKTMGGLLNEDLDDQQAFAYCTRQLVEHGSSWHPEWVEKKIHNHCFNNFFLRELRKVSTPIFRRVIGRVYGTQFDEGITTYYRWDARKPEVVFAEGFELKADERNTATARKDQLSDSFTGSGGISTSTKHLPNHNLELISMK